MLFLQKKNAHPQPNYEITSVKLEDYSRQHQTSILQKCKGHEGKRKIEGLLQTEKDREDISMQFWILG